MRGGKEGGKIERKNTKSKKRTTFGEIRKESRLAGRKEGREGGR